MISGFIETPVGLRHHDSGGYEDSDGPVSVSDRTQITLGGVQAGAFLLGHELGHKLNKLFDDSPQRNPQFLQQTQLGQ